MELKRRTYITGAGLNVGVRVKLKVTKPPCCGFEPKVYGIIVGKGRDGIKWRVQFEGESEPMDVRAEDLLLLKG